MTSAADLEGNYWMRVSSAYSSNGNSDDMLAYHLTKRDTEDELVLTNLFGLARPDKYNPNIAQVPVKVDLSDMTCSISSQALKTEDFKGNVHEWVLSVKQFNTGTFEWEEVSDAIGHISDNGVIDFKGYSLQLYSTENELLCIINDVSMEPISIYEPSEPEWKPMGTAKVNESWFSYYINGYVETATVTYWQNTRKPELYALKDMYDAVEFRGLSRPTAGNTREGWLILDASVPECVCIYPFTNSGA